MPDPDREPVELDDRGPTRLCIVSHDRLLCGPFVAALQTVLSPHDEFEIIQDRRRDRSSTKVKLDVADQQSVDRRRHPHVDRLLQMDGFAIVPATADVKGHRLSVLPTAATNEALALDDADTDEREQLASVLSFKRRQALWLVCWLTFAGFLGAGAVLLLFPPAAKTLVTRALSDVQPSAGRPPHRIDAPPVTESSPAAVSKNPEPARALQAHTSAPAAPGPITGIPHVSNVEPPATASPEVTPAELVDLPRVELIRNPAASEEGQGKVYAVRISDTGGQPLVGADVLLFARMEDGTEESIPLDPGPEPGTYQGTAPPAGSPVDLRIRVTTSDRRVELPLAP